MPPYHFNYLGIQAPTNTLRSTWVTVKNDLKAFLASSRDAPTSLAHVEGPSGSGKSTGMLEYVWEETRSSDPQTTVIYIPSFRLEAIMLHAYFSSTASPHERLRGNTSLGIDTAEPKLHIATVDDLRLTLQADTLEDFKYLPRSIVLLIDLELAPTVEGELLLSELGLWCYLRMDARQEAQTTLITMASFSRRPAHNFLADNFRVHCSHIAIAPSDDDPDAPPDDLLRAPEMTIDNDEFEFFKQFFSITFPNQSRNEDMNRLDRILEDTASNLSPSEEEESVETMVDILGTRSAIVGHVQSAPIAPTVVIITDHNLSEESLDGLYSSNVVRLYTILGNDDDNDMVNWFGATADVGPKIVIVSSQVQSVLHIPGVSAIVFYGTSSVKEVFHSRSSLVASMCRRASKMEIMQAQSYAHKTSDSDPSQDEIAFYCVHTPQDDKVPNPEFDDWPPIPDPPAYEGDLMRLSLEICQPWPGPDSPREYGNRVFPLPPTLDDNRIWEMWRRLGVVGCLRTLFNERTRAVRRMPQMGGVRAERTIGYLEKYYNRGRNVPLAFFMAGIADAESERTKRVMIRIASLVEVGIPEILEETGLMLSERDHPDAEEVLDIHAHRAILSVCEGAQKHEGSIWIALELFVKTEHQNSLGEVDEDFALIRRETYQEIKERVRDFESAFGIDISEDILRDTTLDHSELAEVYRNLCSSWSSHILFFKRDNPQPRNAVSLIEVKMCGLAALDMPATFRRDPNGGNMKFAFYISSDIDANDDTLTTNDLTFLPVPQVEALAGDHRSMFNRTLYYCAS